MGQGDNLISKKIGPKGVFMIEIKNALEYLKVINPRLETDRGEPALNTQNLKKVLVADRGQIAKRFFIALSEENIPSVAIVTDEERGQSWYDLAGEVVFIGKRENFFNLDIVIAATLLIQANAIYPGFGSFVENDLLIDKIEAASREFNNEIIFMGPIHRDYKNLRNKENLYRIAEENNIPTLKSPLKGRIFISEVQLFNNQFVGLNLGKVERSTGRILLEESGVGVIQENNVYERMKSSAVKLADALGFESAGGASIVKFRYNPESGEFGLMDVRARMSRSYAILDLLMDLDLVKRQIGYFNQVKPLSNSPASTLFEDSEGYVVNCRIYALDTEGKIGVIKELDLPGFNGVRNDFGFKEGDRIFPNYDPLIGEVTVRGPTRKVALIRLERALQEIYIKGIQTNVENLLEMVRVDLSANYDVKFNGDSTGDDGTVILGAYTEYIKRTYEVQNELRILGDLENTLNNRNLLKVPTQYKVESSGVEHKVEFLQISLHSCYAFLNGAFKGEIALSNRTYKSGDYLFLYKNRSIRIRVDNPGGWTRLFMKGADNKTRYFRLKIKPGGEGLDGNSGKMKSPFQGTFVKFGENKSGGALKIGDQVQKGDPLIVLSSMKMETTVYSTVNGVLTYLIEEGNSDKLLLGKTPDGKAIGKGVSEGELLAIIRPQTSETFTAGLTSKNGADRREPGGGEKLDYIFSDTFVNWALENVEESLELLIFLTYKYLCGFIQQDYIADDIVKVLRDIIDRADPKAIKQPFNEMLEKIIMQYGHIRRIFSPTLAGNLSYFSELNLYLNSENHPAFIPSGNFIKVFVTLFESTELDEKWEKSWNYEISLLFQRAYHACQEHAELIRLLVDLSYFKFPKETLRLFKKIISSKRFERIHLDDSLVDFILLKNRSQPLREKTIGQGSKNDQLSDVFEENFEANLIPDDLPTAVKNSLKACVDRLSKDYKPVRLAPLFSGATPYLLESKEDENEKLYVVYVYTEAISVEALRSIIFNGLKSIINYVARRKYKGNRLEILLPDETIDITSRFLNGSDEINVSILEESFENFHIFFTRALLEFGIIHTRLKHPGVGMAPGQIAFRERFGKLFFESLLEQDALNPYAESQTSPADQKVFSKDKWPVEVWAANSFDQGEMEEYKIKSIDEFEWVNPKTGKSGFKPVGGKILKGQMAGKACLFFMKDSRVSGGATGNLEGLKYVAAAYIAYMRNLPLYIWNDGAGANIKEGMVSLNRAAQGFMMNTLLSERVSAEDFEAYTKNNPDPKLVELFTEMDKQFGFDVQALIEPRSVFIVAVGTGSSAGLDVYGSSQATIQVMIDSDQSYRVLTGSNVIRSVTGEDISNYDIGGAVVMGKRTGIVDLIAENKLHLIKLLRQVNELFSVEKEECKINIPDPQIIGVRNDTDEILSEMIVVNDALIRSNVDDGFFLEFKKEYEEGGSLVGGFARLGGRRSLILGARSDFGIRSFATVIRARELLKISDRTATPRILIFGKNWWQDTSYHDLTALRAKSDFIKNLQGSDQLQINIIKHVAGLQAIEINSSADAIIFIRSAELDPDETKFVEKNVSFIVSTLGEALEIARRLMGFLKPLSSSHALPENLENSESIATSDETPAVPADIVLPYDIIASVIKPSVDKDSFLEMSAAVNDPVRGPSLVTGFARLGGVSVGIIADQPCIMGGAPDAPGTEKFRVFTELLNKHNIPLLMLSNAPGFMPGTRQESLRIQAIGGESLDANILGNIPVVSVVLNQNYGGRQIHAFSKFLRPGIAYIALENALLAVMGASAAFDLFQGPKFNELIQKGDNEAAGALHQKFFGDFNEKSRASNDALKTGVLDWVIEDIKELRSHMLKGLDLAIKRCDEIFSKSEK